MEKNFTVITDHRALLSILKEHRSNKSYNSRLSRLIDRLILYNFTIEHMPGAKMGLVNYISRTHSQELKKVSTYDEHFVVASISKIRNSMKHLIKNKRNTLQKLNSILKLHSPSSYSKLISRKKLPFVPQLTLSYSTVNPQLNIPYALQMPLKIRRSQFAPKNHTTNNSHSINKLAAKAVQMSDNQEWEHSEQINPKKPLMIVSKIIHPNTVN